MGTKLKAKKPTTPKKTAKKVALGEITNLIIIDASGSMQSKVEEVKGGLKILFTDIQKDANKDQKKVKTNTIVVDFSSPGDFNTLINSKDSLTLDGSIADNYVPRGMTALFDAIHNGFGLVPTKQKAVFVSILTDGEENSSREATAQSIKDLIEKKRKEGWTITFMGTTEASIEKAKSLGIAGGNTLKFKDSKKGMGQSFAAMANVRSAHYMASMDFMEEDNQLRSRGASTKDLEKLQASYTAANATLMEEEQKKIDKDDKQDSK